MTAIRAGHVGVLLESMQKASVSGAFIIQPGNHLYDHSYVASVLHAHPDKFVGALLANPTAVRIIAVPNFVSSGRDSLRLPTGMPDSCIHHLQQCEGKDKQCNQHVIVSIRVLKVPFALRMAKRLGESEELVVVRPIWLSTGLELAGDAG
jgi:hypothetical protein